MGDLDTLTKLALYYRAEDDYESEGVTLLMYSCARTDDSQMSITRYLVNTLHVDVTKADSCHRNALMHSVLASNHKALVYLLDQGKPLIKPDKVGVTPLMLACANGNTTIAEKLLQSKYAKDLALRTDVQGRNAFHYAAMHGYVTCTALLKAYQCDMNAQDDQGWTPVVYAVRGGHHRMVAGLLKRAADLTISDNQNRSALHHCFYKTNTNIK